MRETEREREKLKGGGRDIFTVRSRVASPCLEGFTLFGMVVEGG